MIIAHGAIIPVGVTRPDRFPKSVRSSYPFQNLRVSLINTAFASQERDPHD